MNVVNGERSDVASRLVQIKSVEQFRQMHEAGVARYVLHKMNGQIGLDEPTSPGWAVSPERVIEGAILDKLFWYYVEEDDSPITGDEE